MGEGGAGPAPLALLGGGGGGRVAWELLLPPAAALRGCSAAASGAGAAVRASRTEPSRQVHGCGDGNSMTGHHGWGYGHNDGRRRPRPAPTRWDSLLTLAPSRVCGTLKPPIL